MILKNTWLIAGSAVIFINYLCAEGNAEDMPVRDQGLMQTLTMVLIALAFFYFIMWRPEQKRRKALEEQRAAIKKGDRVTAMGIIGTVVSIEPQTVILKMCDGSKIEFLKAAINEILPDEEPKK